eukprot:TRINITY_DN17646_c0_g1_i1.p1 TRINITY_DN17646_c0_g1~~TRINITY_DN17646_c0_g1_i1.p1  ORF type:complete len:125 (-),score=11.73 TRINITY_DN17646_c0_g1_i1:288-662(-)
MAFFEATLSRGSVFTSKFLDSQTGGKPLQQTTISVYHSTEGFHVEFVAEDSKIESNFTSHNDPLWKGSDFEIVSNHTQMKRMFASSLLPLASILRSDISSASCHPMESAFLLGLQTRRGHAALI